MAKIEYRATWFSREDEWEDCEDGFTNELDAINRGKQYLSGAKDGAYVVVAKIENIKRIERGAVKVSAYK